ncbi:hypothetical protein FACS1894219_03860 [Clostridia bacterium]|nr:hypothetical protein FACS1894219_03860 [Clostridia bacterium]
MAKTALRSQSTQISRDKFIKDCAKFYLTNIEKWYIIYSMHDIYVYCLTHGKMLRAETRLTDISA